MKDEATARLARQVSDALGQMLESSPGCPFGADRFDWSSDVLDELARAVATLAQVVDRLAGGASPTDSIDDLAGELATAIVRQRNSLVGEGAGHRRRHGIPVPPGAPV